MADNRKTVKPSEELPGTKLRQSLAAVRASAPRPPLSPVKIDRPSAAVPEAQVKVPVVNDVFDYAVALKFAFIGTGQGGSRIADSFWKIGYRRCCAFNTTDADFSGLSEEMPKLSLDVGGAMKDTALARAALRGREEEVRELFSRAWGSQLDYALVCASLGGGTGSGTAPALVRLARKYMEDSSLTPRVGALISLPTSTEGYQICRNAVLGFRELVELRVSPLIIIDNARVNLLFRPPMSRLHETVNGTTAQLLHLFNQLAAVHSPFLTFDQSELLQVLDAGMITMGSSNIDVSAVRDPADVSKAIREQVSANVLAAVDISTGSKAACLFVASQDVLDKLPLDYFDAGYTQLDRIMSAEGQKATVVHRGLYLGSDEGLQAYVIVGGLDLPRARLAELSRRGGLLGDQGASGVAAFLGIDDAV